MIWDATGSPSDPNKPSDDQHPLKVPHSQLTVAALPSSSDWNNQAATVSVRFDWIEVGRLKDQPPGPFTGTPPTLLAIQPAGFPSSNDRPVLVQDSGGSGMTANGNASAPGLLTLGNLPAPVPALQAPFSVLYNLLPVSRGKTVSNEVVGSGDAAAAGQSFPLAKSPVTYLEKGASYASTIAMRVDGQPWKEVASFYGQPADARIFVTSEDEKGKTHVSFGDGVNGARLPTGTNNVVATYRTGAGAASPPAGKLTVIAQSFPGLKSVLNPVAASGGADPDPPDQIRQYAPRSVLTFGRAVSVFDYEAIAAQAPGVTRARATWSWDDARQRTAVTVYVGDDAGAVASARSVVLAAGDPNRPVTVTLATPIPVLLLLAILATPGMDADAISAGVKSALTDPETGLFAPTRLRIGQPLFDSQIEAACLSVEAPSRSSRACSGSDTSIPDRCTFRRGRVLRARRPTPCSSSRSLTPMADDSYVARYADKLWQLLPAVYRTRDVGEAPARPGRCASWSSASARRWPPCGGASTGCGRTSRSRPATTG